MNLQKVSNMFHQIDSTIDISGNLTTYEQRAYMACLAIAWKQLEKDYYIGTFETSVREFSDIMEIGGSSINITHLRKALEKINNTQVKYNISDKHRGIKKYGAFVLVSDFQVEEFDKKSKVRFGLPRHVYAGITKRIKEGRIKEGKDETFTHEELVYTDTYTTRDLKRVMSLETSGIKLDGWIEKWGSSKDIPPITLDETKMLLGSEGKYKGRFTSFRERILDPAINELNNKGDKLVSYDTIRTGENIAGKKNPRGWVQGIQFRYRKKPKNDVPNIQEFSGIYDLVEMFPKSVQKYKTLIPTLERAIIQYDKDFVLQQVKYTIGHCDGRGWMKYLKFQLNDEAYDTYLAHLPKEKEVEVVEEPKEEKKIEIDISNMMEIFTIMMDENNDPKEREEARIKLLPFKSMLKDFPEDPFYTEEKSVATPDGNKLIRMEDIEYSKEEIDRALRKAKFCGDDLSHLEGDELIKRMKEIGYLK